MTVAGGSWVVAIVGAVVGILFYVAMTAASTLGQPISIVIAAALGAGIFWLIDRYTEDES